MAIRSPDARRAAYAGRDSFAFSFAEAKENRCSPPSSRRRQQSTGLLHLNYSSPSVYKKFQIPGWVSGIFGTLEGTRTPDLLIRSQSLYPTELPAHNASQALGYNSTTEYKMQVFFSKICKKLYMRILTDFAASLDRKGGTIVKLAKERGQMDGL